MLKAQKQRQNNKFMLKQNGIDEKQCSEVQNSIKKHKIVFRVQNNVKKNILVYKSTEIALKVINQC